MEKEEAANEDGKDLKEIFSPSTSSLLNFCKDKLKAWPPLLKRDFYTVNNTSHDGFIFRIMQWNILADALCKGSENFVKCPKEALEWEMRKYLILQEILIYSPDICCFQEVDHYSFLAKELENVGYRGTFFPKPNSPCLTIEDNQGPDGCALFYKVDKFSHKLITNHILKAGTIKTNHVLIFCVLESVQKNFEIQVIVTHLKAKVGNERMRNLQGRDLLQFIEQHNPQSLIICGDFNGDPEEPVYKTITSSGLNLSNAYTKLQDFQPQYTTWKIREEGEVCTVLDYVFYSSEMFDIFRLLRFPTSEEIGKDRLPSFMYPSDHLSLVVDFKVQHIH